ncbi:Ankyrin repeat-containing domain [Pseudocohnilembus persalinus]|uniref:Ankyrin repeat-containing domain n=1 Tax=Pseudocohnilembus persalinus TaxID=266149 RepID=A0A0V0QQY0_PSEPJ|nr:Ankyrin repeat-containing domain [Pseudocohnilembus persalinus]|eukprot:KRX04681.1 Ankyrin repeat-containing domain [Pseudocohnilembus persalinus]
MLDNGQNLNVQKNSIGLINNVQKQNNEQLIKSPQSTANVQIKDFRENLQQKKYEDIKNYHQKQIDEINNLQNQIQNTNQKIECDNQLNQQVLVKQKTKIQSDFQNFEAQSNQIIQQIQDKQQQIQSNNENEQNQNLKLINEEQNQQFQDQQIQQNDLYHESKDQHKTKTHSHEQDSFTNDVNINSQNFIEQQNKDIQNLSNNKIKVSNDQSKKSYDNVSSSSVNSNSGITNSNYYYYLNFNNNLDIQKSIQENQSINRQLIKQSPIEKQKDNQQSKSSKQKIIDNDGIEQDQSNYQRQQNEIKKQYSDNSQGDLGIQQLEINQNISQIEKSQDFLIESQNSQQNPDLIEKAGEQKQYESNQVQQDEKEEEKQNILNQDKIEQQSQYSEQQLPLNQINQEKQNQQQIQNQTQNDLYQSSNKSQNLNKIKQNSNSIQEQPQYNQSDNENLINIDKINDTISNKNQSSNQSQNLQNSDYIVSSHQIEQKEENKFLHQQTELEQQDSSIVDQGQIFDQSEQQKKNEQNQEQLNNTQTSFSSQQEEQMIRDGPSQNESHPQELQKQKTLKDPIKILQQKSMYTNNQLPFQSSHNFRNDPIFGGNSSDDEDEGNDYHLDFDKQNQGQIVYQLQKEKNQQQNQENNQSHIYLEGEKHIDMRKNVSSNIEQKELNKINEIKNVDKNDNQQEIAMKLISHLLDDKSMEESPRKQQQDQNAIIININPPPLTENKLETEQKKMKFVIDNSNYIQPSNNQSNEQYTKRGQLDNKQQSKDQQLFKQYDFFNVSLEIDSDEEQDINSSYKQDFSNKNQSEYYQKSPAKEYFQAYTLNQLEKSLQYPDIQQQQIQKQTGYFKPQSQTQVIQETEQSMIYIKNLLQDNYHQEYNNLNDSQEDDNTLQRFLGSKDSDIFNKNIFKYDEEQYEGRESDLILKNNNLLEICNINEKIDLTEILKEHILPIISSVDSEQINPLTYQKNITIDSTINKIIIQNNPIKKRFKSVQNLLEKINKQSQIHNMNLLYQEYNQLLQGQYEDEDEFDHQFEYYEYQMNQSSFEQDKSLEKEQQNKQFQQKEQDENESNNNNTNNVPDKKENNQAQQFQGNVKTEPKITKTQSIQNQLQNQDQAKINFKQNQEQNNILNYWKKNQPSKSKKLRNNKNLKFQNALVSNYSQNDNQQQQSLPNVNSNGEKSKIFDQLKKNQQLADKNNSMSRYSLLMRSYQMHYQKRQKMSPIEQAFQAIIDNSFIELEEIFNDHPNLSVEQTDSQNNTLLIVAAQCGNIEIIQFLLSKFKDINHQNIDGDTALHKALSYGNDHAADLLILNGAFQNIKNNNGLTPWDIVLKTN